MIKNIALFYNKEKKKAVNIANSLKKIAAAENISLQKDVSDDTQVVISVGGDGTLLKTARDVVKYEVPIAHINIGTLGFLGFEVRSLKSFFTTLLEGNFITEERIMLEASVNSKNFVALNDIVIKNGDLARVINLEVFAEGKKVYTINGDGLIISTPTGSTAYSLASGGPILTPNSVLMIINPLNPHTLSTRPVVVEDIPIKISCAHRKEEIIITADGQEHRRIKPPVDVHIRIYNKRLRLVRSKEDFFELLSRKMKWG
jgi:NAD+ kinase